MESRARSRSRFVVLAALVLLAGSGVAVAAIPGGDGAIQGCYDVKSGDLRVIDPSAGQECSKKERPIGWNAQGPTGPQGLPGQDGAKGDPGEPGPGLASLEDLEGLPCRVGEPDEGTMEVGYSSSSGTAREVSLTCTSSTLHTLTVTQPTGGRVTGGPIDCGDTCSVAFAPGNEVELTATPASGFVFDGWTGDCSGKGTCTVTMDGDHAVGATFRQTHRLALSVTQVNGDLFNPWVATITSQPAGLEPCSLGGFGFASTSCFGFFVEGTEVTLRHLGPGNRQWSGACAGTAPTCTVTMSGFRSVSLHIS
jgi:uncharacterized repeat protein (TIGR02543 family)